MGTLSSKGNDRGMCQVLWQPEKVPLECNSTLEQKNQEKLHKGSHIQVESQNMSTELCILVFTEHPE